MKKAMFVAVAAIAITARGAINVTASRDYVDKKVYTLQTNLEERIESAQPGDYSIVSNKAMHALQDTGGTITGGYLEVDNIHNGSGGSVKLNSEAGGPLIEMKRYDGAIWTLGYGWIMWPNGKLINIPTPTSNVNFAFDADVTRATNNLATVAHSGSYDDLSDKPTKLSQFQNDSGFITASTAPVKTVNSKTGNVTLGATDVGAIPQTGMVVNVTSGTMHFKPRLSVGTWPESYKPIQIPSGSGTGFTFGDGVRVESDVSMALGTGALATNGYVFVWNGDDDRYYSPVPSISNPYASRYRGGFYINPKIRAGTTNPLQNFWIGDTTLNDWIGVLAPAPDLSGYLPLDYFRNGQTIPMYWGDGTKLCDFGANWIGNLEAVVQNNSDAINAIGNYSVVSNRAMSAIQNSGTQAIDGVLEIYNSRSPNPPMERIKLYVDDSGVCHLAIDGIADYVIPLNLSGGTLALTSDIPQTASDISCTNSLGVGTVQSVIDKFKEDYLYNTQFFLEGHPSSSSEKQWDTLLYGRTFDWRVNEDYDVGFNYILVKDVIIKDLEGTVGASMTNEIASLKREQQNFAPNVSNVVTQAYIQDKLQVYLYIGQDGGVYVHTPTNEEEEQ